MVFPSRTSQSTTLPSTRTSRTRVVREVHARRSEHASGPNAVLAHEQLVVGFHSRLAEAVRQGTAEGGRPSLDFCGRRDKNRPAHLSRFFEGVDIGIADPMFLRPQLGPRPAFRILPEMEPFRRLTATEFCDTLTGNRASPRRLGATSSLTTNFIE